MIKRIGILGGTFDPIHCGHLELAHKALEAFFLDKVLFLPTASPPHKNPKTMTYFNHRVTMVKIALENSSTFEVNTLEKNLSSPNYTINTIEYLLNKTQAQATTELFFITGFDAFLELKTWERYEDLLKTIHFIVIARVGYNIDVLQALLLSLHYKPTKEGWRNDESTKKIFLLEDKVINTSSSLIKNKISNNQDLHGLVPDKVIAYIEQIGLYTT